MEGYLLGQTDTVTYLKRMKKTNRSDRPIRLLDSYRPTGEHTDDLLSIVVGFEDVADGSAVAPPACRLQNETKQPLVVLMR